MAQRRKKIKDVGWEEVDEKKIDKRWRMLQEQRKRKNVAKKMKMLERWGK